MIEIVKGNILDSEANFVVHSCDYSGNADSDFDKVLPHTEKERMKYIRHCNKNGIELNGTNQFVPTEVWALVMVDTMKNNNITAFDSNYQYIVNMFCQSTFDGEFNTDLKAMKKALEDIREKAHRIGATVSVSYNTRSANWNDFYNVIKKVFEKSDVNVEIWR